MSEQLWYTWSVSGFGMTTAGFRVRAASRYFMNARNIVDMQGERFLTLLKYLNYSLPLDTVDPYTVLPQQAPRSLAFVRAAQEWLLVQRVYTGLDGMKRPGAYFAHLLTALPEQSSWRPEGSIAFSAREAIELWQSDFWKDSDRGLDPGRLELPEVANQELRPGPLSAKDVVPMANAFRYMLCALLTLPSSGEGKRLYIAAPPDVVAALIWGVTHCLPRTLTIMRNLTFSTYEKDIVEQNFPAHGLRKEEQTLPLIVGTCWLTPPTQHGLSAAQPDLPAQYYQPANPYGLAINCYLPDRMTPLEPASPEIVKFVDFATRCFIQNTPESLRMMCDEAEKRNISEIPEFLQHYASFQETLSKEEVMNILNALLTKARAVIEKTRLILEQWKPPSPVEMPQWESFAFEAEMLKRDNVRRSIILLIAQDAYWWRDQGKPMLQALCTLIDGYSKQSIEGDGSTFIYTITSNRSWKNKSQEINAQLRQLIQDYNYTTPDILSAFTERLKSGIYKVQEELASALYPLASDVAERVQQELKRGEDTRTFWMDNLRAITPSGSRVKVWTVLLQYLSVPDISFNQTYKQWWQEYGRPHISQFHLDLSRNRSRNLQLASAFTGFAKKAAGALSQALIENNGLAITFWTEVWQTAEPFEDDLATWATLLKGLTLPGYSAHYEAWWSSNGKTIITNAYRLVGSQRNDELGQAFTTFSQQIMSEFQRAIENGQQEACLFWEDVLATVAPYTSEPDAYTWLLLLSRLWRSIYTSAFQQWWKRQGQTAIPSIRRFAHSNPNSKLARDLSRFSEGVAKELHAELQKNLEQAINTPGERIVFLLKLLAATASSTEPSAWTSLLQMLPVAGFAYSWQTRALLLQAWAKVPALQDNQYILGYWLNVRWSELGDFLSLGLPEYWCMCAIRNVLFTHPDIEPQAIVSIVANTPAQFESALIQLIQTPESQLVALEFFAYLATYRYLRKLQLFDMLISACGYQKTIVEQLLTRSHLDTPGEVEDLLELSKQLLAAHELPPTMIDLLHSYLANFDVNRLRTPTTRDLLHDLEQRKRQPELRLPDDLQAGVELWSTIAAFIDRQDTTGLWLRDFTRALQTNSRLFQFAPETQTKLAGVLIPTLVEHVTTDTNLVRALENLSHLLVGSASQTMEPELLLLEKMMPFAREYYGQVRPPITLVAYARVVLEEASYLPSPRREPFIDRCLDTLLGGVDTRNGDPMRSYSAHWPLEIAAEWEAYLQRKNASVENEALTRLRNALASENINTIASAYDPILDNNRSITQDERDRLDVALRFTKAYKNGNDMALRAICQEIRRPPYNNCFHLTTEQLDYIRPLLQSYSMPAPKALALPGVAHYSQNGSQPPTMDGRRVPPAFVASVYGEGIMLGLFEDVHMLKEPYKRYRISLLREQIERMRQKKQYGRKEKWRGEECDALEQLFPDPQQLRQMTLDDLVNDALFQNGVKEGTITEPTDLESEVQETLRNFKIYHQPLYQKLLSEQSISDERTKNVLRIFRRRELLTLEHGKRGLNKWIKDCRNNKGANITIYYDQAGIQPPEERDKLWRPF